MLTSTVYISPRYRNVGVIMQPQDKISIQS